LLQNPHRSEAGGEGDVSKGRACFKPRERKKNNNNVKKSDITSSTCAAPIHQLVSGSTRRVLAQATMQRERVFLQKMNLTLVYVLKQEWPHNWPEFIAEIVQASTTNEVNSRAHASKNPCPSPAMHGARRYARGGKLHAGLALLRIGVWRLSYLWWLWLPFFFSLHRCCARTTCRF
jgi:hypothetical protein